MTHGFEGSQVGATPIEEGRHPLSRLLVRIAFATVNKELSSRVICGKATDGARDQSHTQEGCAARSRQGSVARVPRLS
jgi:hypothetical protein